MDRRLLFVDTTNSPSQADDGLAMDVIEPQKQAGRHPRTRTLSTPVGGTKRLKSNNISSHQQPWVEIKVKKS